MWTKNNPKCDDFQDLIRKNSAQSSEYKNHKNTCSECRVDELLFLELNLEDGNLPLIPVDDVTRRSIINDVLGKLEAPVEVNDKTSRKKVENKKYFLIAAAIIGIVITSFAILKFLPGVKAKDGRVLLISDMSLSSTGETVTAGTKITTNKTPAVITVGGISRILIYPGSEITVSENSVEKVVVHINKGNILNVVDRKSGDPLFVVRTKNSRIVVVGTIFEVRHESDTDRITVLRGKVKVAKKDEVGVLVSSSMTLSTSDMKVASIEENELSKLSIRLRLAEKFSESSNGKLELESTPPGARVIHDGMSIGYTPMVVTLKTGVRTLRMSLDGHEDWEKSIEIREGRNFISAQLKMETASRYAGNIEKKTKEPETGDDFPVFAPLDVKNIVKKNQDKDKKTGTKKIVRPVPVQNQRIENPKEQKIPPIMISQIEDDIPVVEKSIRNKEFTALELFREARKLKLRKNWNEAVSVYKKLIAAYPYHSLSVVSLVSIGEIQLEQLNDPGSARINYLKYLNSSPKGSLAKEAAWGLVRVYRKQGATGSEKKALTSFLKNYPDALQIPAAKKRLKELNSASSK
ncbi:PEGA domain-containing protein [Myxococcota bacterium]|nr:PEGA domain-containing protein [Myxococcota bacterium]MBU1381762.1 PEGA domain-containing protein [Myxococcota bacterium]MBU1496399.1 PEGA domain-containing protein [Myxococcota bacterium]